MISSESRRSPGLRTTVAFAALLGVTATACTETVLMAHVVIVDAEGGHELERRSRTSPTAGQVRVAQRPGGGDVLAWGLNGHMHFRTDGWEQIDLDMTDFDVAPVDGQGIPEVFAFADDRAFLWSPETEQFEANLKSKGAASSVVAADWDGDGDTDLVAVGPGFGAWYHPREPDGLGEAQVFVETFGLDQYLRVGDLDRDGRLDLVRSFDDQVFVGYGGADGAIDEEVSTPYPNTELRELELGDVTGDGYLDVVLAGTGGIHVLENGGDRTLSAGAFVLELASLIEVVDIDQDGDADILGQPPHEELVQEPFENRLFLLESLGGELASPRSFVEPNERIVDLASGTDADGTRWIALSTYTYEEIQVAPEPE